MTEFVDLPGSWIDGDDRDTAWTVMLLLGVAAEAFNEAVVAQRAIEGYLSDFNPIDRTTAIEHGPRDQRLMYRITSKAYVFALDDVRQLLSVMRSECILTKDAAALCDRYVEDYSVVRRIRNSLHHVEDRIRGIGPRRETLETSLIALSVTTNGRFGATTELSCVEYLPVTTQYLDEVRNRLLDLIWAFPWLGPGGIALVRAANA